MDPEQSAAAIAAIISRDATLIYGLLRLANSALYGRQGKIESPVQAVSMLGMDRVFRWASLLVLSGYNDCPIGYLGFALQRARACELVGEAHGSHGPRAYMTGLLSTLDSILNTPLGRCRLRGREFRRGLARWNRGAAGASGLLARCRIQRVDDERFEDRGGTLKRRLKGQPFPDPAGLGHVALLVGYRLGKRHP